MAHMKIDLSDSLNMENNSLNQYVGRRLKERRSFFNMSQKELGSLLGLTYQQIQKYENGKNKINLENLYKISKVLDVSIDYFFNGYSANNNYIADKNSIDYESYESNKIIIKEIATLIRAFQNIKNPKIRLKIIELVKTVSHNSGENE